MIPHEHHQDLQHLEYKYSNDENAENKAWSASCLEMLALTSSCLSFPIRGVAGVSHPPLQSSLVSVPWQAQVLDGAQDCRHRVTHWASGTAEHQEWCVKGWGGIYISESLIPASVLHLLMMKQPTNPGLSLFVLGFLVPVQNRALAMGRGPKAQPGRGEAPAPVTVACAPSHLSLSVLPH